MDPVTHCLVGGLTAKTANVSKHRFWVMMLLGEIPDIDFLASALGSWAFAFQHRSMMTHSLLGILLQAFFYAWIFKRWDPGAYGTRAFHYSLPLFMHVVCDYLTIFGVPLFAPFTFHEFSADLTMDLNLLPMMLMVGGLFYMYRKNVGGWNATRWMWASWGLYLMIAASGKAYAMRLIEVPRHNVTALPTVVNPFSWRAVRVDGTNHVYQGLSIDLLKGKTNATRHYAMPNGDFPVQASLKSREVQDFLKRNRWPMVRIMPLSDGWNVEWGKLLFSMRGPVRGKVLVQIDSKGNVLRSEKIATYWNPDPITP